MTSSYAKELMIGRDHDVRTLKSVLLCGSGYERRPVQVIAIVGVGGLGKTALARTIFHDPEVQKHFEGAFYWLCVSENFDPNRVTKAIIEQVTGSCSSLSELDALQNQLVTVLRGKHFLLVLDDVWNEDKGKWNILQPCLTSGAPGSRILVTTRARKVAENIMNIDYIYDLKGLSDDHSWTLFSSTALDWRTKEERRRLESVGREIVSKCKGVPLLITVMGSVMNSKRTTEDWENILHSKIWSLPEATKKILPVLWLSYHNLPPHLKQCFAYCSMFPKDWEFGKNMLVRLWAAQGFIRPEGNRDREDIGADYFDDLVAWSMFQVVEQDDCGCATRCKMHDLLHDLAEFIANDEIYTFIRGEGESEQCSGTTSTNVRHALFSFANIDDKSSNGNNTYFPRAKTLRTLFINGVVDGNESVIVNLLHQARLLRALIFGGSMHSERIVKLPNAIGKLKHLRYLDLSYSNIVALPEAVCHLRNLQTLNLTSCYKLRLLPSGVGQLVNLRHLEIEETYGLTSMPVGLGKITSLRSLSKFVAEWGGRGIIELQWLNFLQGSLKIEGLQLLSSREEAEKAQIWNKPHLRSLALSNFVSNGHAGGIRRKTRLGTRPHGFMDSERMESVVEGLRPHANLEELLLNDYAGSKLPSWLEGMPHLHKLKLCGCLKLDHLPHLPSLEAFSISELKSETLPDGGWERLVTLQKLEIADSFGLKSLPDGLIRLQSLEDLNISLCHALESLPVGLGQLKKLKSLTIKHSKMLTHLPDSLGQLESLETLEIHFCEKLESLPRSFGQLKVLNCLEIWGCEALGSLPHGLQHLSLLQKLWIKNCPLLSERCKRTRGADWSKISHIPNVYIDGEWIQQQRSN